MGSVTDASGDADLLTHLASALSGALGEDNRVEAIDLAARARLLRIARDVAHATERQNAPLAAYLIGRYVQDAVRSGTSQTEAIEEAASVVRSLIGDPAE
jgi:hypothetical protein